MWKKSHNGLLSTLIFIIKESNPLFKRSLSLRHFMSRAKGWRNNKKDIFTLLLLIWHHQQSNWHILVIWRVLHCNSKKKLENLDPYYFLLSHPKHKNQTCQVYGYNQPKYVKSMQLEAGLIFDTAPCFGSGTCLSTMYPHGLAKPKRQQLWWSSLVCLENFKLRNPAFGIFGPLE